VRCRITYASQADGAKGEELRTSQDTWISVTLELNRSVPQMANLIRPAQINRERAALTAFLSTHLSPDATDERYEWLYCKNPAGMARVWVACEAGEGKIIGVSAAFPRRIYCDGKVARGYVLGDFCIHPDYRSLGPALALQRSTLEGLSRESAEFVFDFPSTSMLAIYKRLRIEPQESAIRFAKPLRADRQIQKRIPTKAAGAALAVAVNAALRLRDAGLGRSSAWTITEETALCGDEFTVAFRQWAPRMGICADRSADYLNWRFLQHPQRRYHYLAARKNDRLCGYLIYHWAGEDATIVDLLAEEEQVLKVLLVETIAVTRGCGVHTLSAPYLGSHPSREVFEECGFQPRESSPVVVLPLPWNAGSLGERDAGRWFLTHGDRES
jgi:hypothetical protein